MTEKIPKIFIQELLERTNIIDLIGNRIILKKMGNNYHALCPFHQEKTPSFVINKAKQFFYCFGCNIYGNSIDFLMKYEGYNFLESIYHLASLHNLKIPYKNLDSYEKKKYLKINILHTILKQVCKIYSQNLFYTSNIHALKYLYHRGINNFIIKKFSLGYASNDQTQIQKFFKKKKINTNISEETGLSTNKLISKKYDRFHQRIIFPIRSQYGKINGFGGRTLNKNLFPKYLNSPETLIFSKKKNLYGIYELYQINPHPPFLIVVEGYLDVISLNQYNIPYVVSIMGTNLSEYQIKSLFQISPNIIFCYDGDKIGQQAHWKSLLSILPYLSDDRTIKFIILPNTEDPNSIIIKEGTQKFLLRIKKSQSFYKFFFNYFMKKIPLNSINSKIKFSKTVIPLIKKIPGKMIRLYLRKILGYKIDFLESEDLNAIISFKHKTLQTKKKIIKRTTMRLLISLILQNPKLVKKISNLEYLKSFHIPGISIFIKLIQYIIQSPQIKIGQLLEYFRDTQHENIFKKLLSWDNMIASNQINQTFLDLLHNLELKEIEYQYNLLILKEKRKGLRLSEKKKIWNFNKMLTSTIQKNK
ncbi:DNA primase [Buchnera aphidicola (Tuberolachnus salignus)]|uniref:DNA primase n=1 Tax=Buchnera aphidicola subsp. Tuberolachnus salignus TaxID=98804 RepID=A0A160SWJ7_BUCTT|nr:DNA primase [Buchnera aphidicola]CUR53020.1 DNA primase [Buchnera aphidicola (Tuberolachnus salignus)]